MLEGREEANGPVIGEDGSTELSADDCQSSIIALAPPVKIESNKGGETAQE